MTETTSPAAAAARPLRWRDRLTLLGHPVDSLTMSEAVEFVGDMIVAGGWHLVVVTNANKLWQAGRDARLAAIMQRAALVIPEFAAVWGARRVGTPVRGFIPGVALMQRLIPEAERRGWSVFFLGARPDVVQAMADRLAVAHPALRIAGVQDGYFRPADEAALRERIRASGADIIFCAMGSPRQEYWLDTHGPTLGVSVGLGVGGSFDVIAGLKKDAPSWMRGRGLEWIYRLWLDPRNLWKRYLVTNSWFVLAIARERLRRLVASR